MQFVTPNYLQKNFQSTPQNYWREAQMPRCNANLDAIGWCFAKQPIQESHLFSLALIECKTKSRNKDNCSMLAYANCLY